MKSAARILLCTALLATAALARADRVFNQAELDALLAPVALYPDAVLSDILVAASYPAEVREAAAWSRANSGLRGDEARRAIEPAPWQPSVKALVAFPEVLQRMDESPVWLRDLGEAYRVHGPYVMDTVQSLRRRAQASGYLRSDGEQQVYEDTGAIVVAPAYAGVVYVRYYDPFVVYGPWWWPAYRPIVWRPWPVYRVVVVSRPVFVHRPVVVSHPVIARREAPRREYRHESYVRVAESRRQPIVRSTPVVRAAPAPRRFEAPKEGYRSEHRSERRGEHRGDRRG